jgi:enoyl-CoA hydratase/carnithine racemase
MVMETEKVILTDLIDNIGVITLNKPEQHNTFDIRFARDLNDTLWKMEHDAKVKIIVIQAKGKHFSTGISLNEFKDKSPQEYRNFLHLMDEHNHTIARMKKIVIAAVQGYAVANGAGLAFASDFTIAADNAQFGTTAINVGLICLGPAVPLMKIVGRKKTLEFILTGKMVSAEEAERLGLVNEVVSLEELKNATMEFARKMAEKSPLALQIGKWGVYQVQDLPYHQAIDYMGELFASLCTTQDAEEGVKAFLEKRKPKWTEK